MNREETTAPGDSDISTGEGSEALVSAVQALEGSASAAQELAADEGNISEASPSEESAAISADTNANEEKILRQVADFDPQDFSARFPYITTTHPVHFLAVKLLEYFGYGLKLAEIARLIELIGYRHNSRNFTDSVHSAHARLRASFTLTPKNPFGSYRIGQWAAKMRAILLSLKRLIQHFLLLSRSKQKMRGVEHYLWGVERRSK